MSTRTLEMALSTPAFDSHGNPSLVPLGAGPTREVGFDEEFGAEHLLVNIGPQHPATHTLRPSLPSPAHRTRTPCP